MKNSIRILGKSLILFTAIFAMASCDKNDDIDSIFRQETWYLTYIEDPESGGKVYANGKIYSIDFKTDKFTAVMPNGATITGNWYADGGGSHSFFCRNLDKSGEVWRDDIASKFFDILNNADSYEGDTNWLQIITKDKNKYMQFGKKRQ